MCYSFKTSIITYSLGLISVVFAFMTRQYILGTLILFFCQIQLSEAIIWKGIDNNNNSLNKLGTNYGKYLLPTHIFAIGFGILISITVLQKRKPILAEYLPLLIGIIFYLYILKSYRKNHSDLTYPTDKCGDMSCQKPNNRLKWPFPHVWYIFSFIISIIILITFVKPLKSKIFILLLFLISFIVSSIIFPNNFGSFWCFVAAILAPVLVLFNYYIINNLIDKDIMT